MNRRGWIQSTSLVAAAGLLPATAVPTGPVNEPADPFPYCLNTSTLQGFKTGIEDELRIAARAGYQGVEPWVGELEAHEKSGHSVEDLGRLVRDLGLKIPSAIGFFEWAVDDETQRRAGIENARRSMELVRKIGGTHIAAPPVGVTDRADIDLRVLAERYVELLEVGRQIGVLPEVELWGFSKTLGRLADVVFVAVASGQPDATILPDVYHMYKGGTPIRGLRMLNGRAMPAIHMNDYPATPDRESISDAHRVYPGDGVAPLTEILRDLREIGFTGHLSLELFNRDYWKQDAETVARNGLQKMQAAVRAAFA
jgi:sugar phosphate isomerase/epimerase